MPTRQFTCDACDFQVRSEGEDELIDFVQQHAQEAHDMEMSQADIRGGWTRV